MKTKAEIITPGKFKGHLLLTLTLAAAAEITLALRNHCHVGLLLGI